MIFYAVYAKILHIMSIEQLPRETNSAVDGNGDVVPIYDAVPSANFPEEGVGATEGPNEISIEDPFLPEYQEYLKLKEEFLREWAAYEAARRRFDNSGGHGNEPPMPEPSSRLAELASIFGGVFE